MEAQRWRRINELFQAAVDLCPDERSSFLEERCSGDESLKLEVESLLASDEQGGDFIEAPAFEVAVELLAGDRPGLSEKEEIAQYEVLALIGRGGMGEVYLAQDTRLGRKVALKFLPHLFMSDRERVGRFLKEARAVSALNHPNIVTIYEIGETDQGRFIAMELINGLTLREMMRGPLPIDRLVVIGGQIASALRVTHDAAIVHRDIKPENIMVRDDGYLKILDFGIARLIQEAPHLSDADFISDPGVIIGTAAYMSPEQALGEPVTASADIFSFGIVLYEMATGWHPFTPVARSGFRASIISDQPAAPSLLNPEIPPRLESLIMKMLEKDFRLRPGAVEVERSLAGQDSYAREKTVAGGFPVRSADSRKVVGREIERSQLRSAFRAAAEGQSTLLCVTGEAGIGKTTLVEEFINEVGGSGAPHVVAHGRSSERLAGTEAYLPILEALESLLRGRGGESFGQMMKLIAPTWYFQIAPAIQPEPFMQSLGELKALSQERLKLELAALLEEISRLRPLILFLDDLHWADVSTVELLAYLATRFDRIRTLIVITYRSSDMLLANHPFIPVKLGLQARRLCHELPLGFLSFDEVENYVAIQFPENNFPREFLELIYAKTEGSPLFLVDILGYLRHRNIVAEEGGRWRLAEMLPDIESDLPESVRSMIQRKIDQLSNEDRRLLIAASLQGHEFDSEVVAKAAGQDTRHVEERLDELERLHSLVRFVGEYEFPDGAPTLRYRFVHALYQNALYLSVRPTRKAALCGEIARALLAHHGEQAAMLAAELAPLFEAARDYSHAADYLLLGSKNASRLFAYREAVTLAQRGLRLLAKLPPSVERARKELMLQTTMGGPLMAIKGFTDPEVAQTYGRARELCQQSEDSPQLFPSLWGLWAFYYSTASVNEAFDVSGQMLGLAEESQQIDRLMLANHVMGVTLLHMGEPSSARSHLERAVAISDPLQDRSIIHVIQQSSITTVLSFGAFALWILGYPEEALKKAREAVAVAESLSHPPSLASTLFYSSILHQFRREPEITEEHARASVALSSEYGFPLFLLDASMMNGWALAQRGEPKGAEELRQSLDALRAVGAKMGSPYFLSLLAESLWANGDIPAALEALERGLTDAGDTGDLLNHAELYRLKGELLIVSAGGEGSGDVLGEAERNISKAIEISREQKAKSLELRGVTSLARLWRRQGRAGEARQALARVYDWFTEGFETPDLKDARDLLDELSRSS